MAPSVQKYFGLGLAPSTKRSYDAASRRFYNFCTKFDIVAPFPLTEHTLCLFAAHLADEGLAPQTAKAYLSAVRNLQLSLGLPDPRDSSSLPVLKRVLAGISRARLSGGQPPQHIRLPITITILSRLHEAIMASSHPDRVLIWAVASLAFFGFFRLGELLLERATSFNSRIHLSWGDVAVDDRHRPSAVKIHLRQSKCDQFGRGIDVVVGRTDTACCPVAAVVAYIKLRQDHPGAFFLSRDLTPVTKGWFVQQIRTMLVSLGLPQNQYAGHSFRIGAATTAAMVGIEDSTIQALGRWQSAAFLQYIRMPRDRLAAISRRLAEP